MQECSSLECFVWYIVNVDTERCGATFQFGLMSDLTLLKKYVENFFRDFHARVACITLEVEPFVLFRFMRSLFIKSRRVWVKARHLGLQEGLFWPFGFALNLSTLMKYMCCFFVFFSTSSWGIRTRLPTISRFHLVCLRARLASPFLLIGFDGSVSTTRWSVFSANEFWDEDVYCRL